MKLADSWGPRERRKALLILSIVCLALALALTITDWAGAAPVAACQARPATVYWCVKKCDLVIHRTSLRWENCRTLRCFGR